MLCAIPKVPIQEVEVELVFVNVTTSRLEVDVKAAVGSGADSH